MRRQTLAISLAVLALSACASSRPPTVALPAAYEAPVAKVPADAVALDRWWLSFDDPVLTGLIEQALKANPDVRTAASRLNQAEATRLGVLAQLLPSGDATASTRRTHTEQLSGTVVNIPGYSTNGTSKNSAANFNVSWEIDLFGRLLAGARAANADVAAERFAYEGARASLAANVADAYFQVRGLAIQLDDARETARIEGSLYDVATRRATLGLTATSDADRVAGDLAQARSQAASLEAELQVERRVLLVLAGRTAEPTANVALPASVGTAPPVPAALPGDLLARRPDVREARSRLAAAAGEQNVAALSFLPTFTLTPGIGWSKTSQPGYASTVQTRVLGGNVTQPVLSIPRLIAQLKVQNALTDQASIAYEKAVETAFSDSEAALVRLEAERRSVTLLADGEVRAKRGYTAQQTGYNMGLIDLQTTLSAEQSWRSVHAQLTAAQVQMLRRTVTAYKALGGGWSSAGYPAPAPPR